MAALQSNIETGNPINSRIHCKSAQQNMRFVREEILARSIIIVISLETYAFSTSEC
jgi:hypothetical protein